MTARDAWVAILGAAVVAEARSLRRHDGATLSEFTRATFRTHTVPGRAAFTAFLGMAAVGYWLHILKPSKRGITP